MGYTQGTDKHSIRDLVNEIRFAYCACTSATSGNWELPTEGGVLMLIFPGCPSLHKHNPKCLYKLYTNKMLFQFCHNYSCLLLRGYLVKKRHQDSHQSLTCSLQ